VTPADLTNPFGPSCCEAGGECGKESARPCGCDPGASHFCADHSWKWKLINLAEAWRDRASLIARDGPDAIDTQLILTLQDCASDLEEAVNE